MMWMWLHAFPLCDADEVAVLQPAYMHLHTGRYSVPTFAGTLPHTNVIYASYCPLQELIYGGLFRLLGFSRWTASGIEMTVHLLLSGLIAGVLWRITKNGWLSGIYWLGTTYLLSPVGRPEEPGLLFAVLAVLCASSRTWHWLLCGVLLGAAGAITPLATVLATAAAVMRLWLELGAGRSFVKLAAGMVLSAVSVTGLIIWWYIHPYYQEAWTQFQRLGVIAFREPLDQLLVELNPFGLASLAIFVVLIGGLLAHLFYRRRAGRLPLPSSMPLIGCLLLISVVGVVLARMLGRPSYDYRWLGYLLPAISIALLDELFRTESRGHRRRNACLAGLIVVGLALPNRDIFRYCIAPLLSRTDSVTFTQAAERVNRIVPRTATVGGDPLFWMTIVDGRPYLAIKWLGSGFWPEYVVSSSLGRNKPYIYEKASWKTKIESEYEEIPVIWPEPGPNHLAFGSWEIPVFRADSDWRFRIWKRRSTGVPGSDVPGPTTGTNGANAPAATSRADRTGNNHWPPVCGDLKWTWGRPWSADEFFRAVIVRDAAFARSCLGNRNQPD